MGELSTRGTNPEEIYANQFAAALLMPAALVQDLSDAHDRYDLARIFEVSQQAMDHRLTN
jgi:Zn-dependent peptidase ImmA (M78 family)